MWRALERGRRGLKDPITAGVWLSSSAAFGREDIFLMGGTYWRFTSSVTANGVCVCFTSGCCLSWWAPSHLGRSFSIYLLPACVELPAFWTAVLCLSVGSGLWEREFSEGGTDPRTFLGKKYTKVVMMHRAGKHKHPPPPHTHTHTPSFTAALLQQLNAAKGKNGLNICKVQSTSLLFIAVYLIIYLTCLSYFMHRLKTTTRQSEFLPWQQ